MGLMFARGKQKGWQRIGKINKKKKKMNCGSECS